jgi:hypothetical protein
MELLRRLLQGHLDLRAAKEAKFSVVEGTDGVIVGTAARRVNGT